MKMLLSVILNVASREVGKYLTHWKWFLKNENIGLRKKLQHFLSFLQAKKYFDFLYLSVILK